MLLGLLGLDELMVERAVAAGELFKHPPQPPVLLAGLPELPLHRRRRRYIHLLLHRSEDQISLSHHECA